MVSTSRLGCIGLQRVFTFVYTYRISYLFLLELFILSCKYIACALKDALHLRLKAKIDRLHELKRSAS